MPKEHITLSKNQTLPFSNIVKAGGFVYISGHTGSRDNEGNPLTDIESQTRQTMEKIKKTLEVAGVTFDDAVKSTVFLKNMEDFGAMNKVYGSFFGDNKPVRSTIVCDLVSPVILVEIEMVLYSG
ncbi:RidA family protein [archaeon]|nr:RidA family protein [archaeon]